MDPKLEQIFTFFCRKALVTPWNVNEQVSIHLLPEILEFVVLQWNTIQGNDSATTRAGFIQSLLCSPRKKLGLDLKEGAEKVVII
jgi:hypothetical protein